MLIKKCGKNRFTLVAEYDEELEIFNDFVKIAKKVQVGVIAEFDGENGEKLFSVGMSPDVDDEVEAEKPAERDGNWFVGSGDSLTHIMANLGGNPEASARALLIDQIFELYQPYKRIMEFLTRDGISAKGKIDLIIEQKGYGCFLKTLPNIISKIGADNFRKSDVFGSLNFYLFGDKKYLMGEFDKDDKADYSQENGWVSPEGKFFQCGYMGHIKWADDLRRTKKEFSNLSESSPDASLMRMGWVKISKGRDIFMSHRQMPQKVIDFFFDYFQKNKVDSIDVNGSPFQGLSDYLEKHGDSI